MQAYTKWETDEVIWHELGRNLGLAFLAVIVIAIILLADFRCCFLVLVSVAFTLIDVIGFVYFWEGNSTIIWAILLLNFRPFLEPS